MAAFILRRLFYGILVLFGVVSLVFLIFSINPGDPVQMLLGQRADKEAIETVRHELGLDLPLWKQYLLYINDVSPVSWHNTTAPESHTFLDQEKYDYTTLFSTEDHALVLKYPYLRRSFQSRRLVTDIIAEAMPGTIILAVSAIAFAVVVGIFTGVLAAIYRRGFFDNFSLLVAVLGMSAPSFFTGIIFAWLGGYVWSAQMQLPGLPIVFLIIGLVIALFSKHKGRRLLEFGLKGLAAGLGLWLLGIVMERWFGITVFPLLHANISLPGTGLNMTGSLYEVDVFYGEYLALENLILPALTLGIRPLAIVIQLTRNSLLEVLAQDFVRTARAKGLSENRVIRHALRNALNPVLTAISGWFASLLAGAVFIEFIFNWKGLGLQVFRSLQNEDFPVIMGAVLVIAVTFVLINIVVDILYGVLDPRVRIK